MRRSPHGERGLKSVRPPLLATGQSRSPHGERGLKFEFRFAVELKSGVALLMESVD